MSTPVNTLTRGAGIFAYDCETRLLEYMVFHNEANAIRASMHIASPGLEGGPVFDLARVASPIFGSRVLSLEEELLLYTQQFYVSITSLEHPLGVVQFMAKLESLI